MAQRCAAIQGGPPDITFTNRLDLWCGTTRIELHEFAIHEYGHIATYLPAQKILLAADMLEDPLWIFNFECAPPERQVAELQRMAAMDIERIYPTHGDLDTIRKRGYDKRFIASSIHYLQRMLAQRREADFMSREASVFIAAELAAGELHWWAPYARVHECNRRVVANLA
ncbi:MAG: hypothetical protein R3E50_02425 [Halioglobus sp.]